MIHYVYWYRYFRFNILWSSCQGHHYIMWRNYYPASIIWHFFFFFITFRLHSKGGELSIYISNNTALCHVCLKLIYFLKKHFRTEKMIIHVSSHIPDLLLLFFFFWGYSEIIEQSQSHIYLVFNYVFQG